MADVISPTQIRGARAMLGWSMLDLANAARVSVSSIKRAEDGTSQPSSERLHAMIRDALETEGVRFLPDEGRGLGLRLQR